MERTSLSADAVLEASQADLFWVPSDATVVDRPEIVYLASPRALKYTNAVLRTRAPDERLPALIQEVARAHAHTTSRWMVYPSHAGTGLEEALKDGGYAPQDEHDSMTLAVSDYVPRRSDRIVVRRVVDLEGVRSWIDVCNRAFGGGVDVPEDKLPHELSLCTGDGARTVRFVAVDADSGEPLASSGINRYPDLGFGLLWGGGTVPEARGRGAYSALVEARMQQCRRWGIGRVGLFARTTTSAPIVEAQGFERGGRMTYWERPAVR